MFLNRLRSEMAIMPIMLRTRDGKSREWQRPADGPLDPKKFESFNLYSRGVTIENDGEFLFGNDASRTIDHIFSRCVAGRPGLDDALLKEFHRDEGEFISLSSFVPTPELAESDVPYRNLEVLHRHEFVVEISENTDGINKPFHLHYQVFLGSLHGPRFDQLFYFFARQSSLEDGDRVVLKYPLVFFSDVDQFRPADRIQSLHDKILAPLWWESIPLLALGESNAAQLKHIEEHKYFKSQVARQDVGGQFAVQDWCNQFGESFRAYKLKRMEAAKHFFDWIADERSV